MSALRRDPRGACSRVGYAAITHAHRHPPVAPALQVVEPRPTLHHHEEIAAPLVVHDADAIILGDDDLAAHLAVSHSGSVRYIARCLPRAGRTDSLRAW